MDCGSWVVGFGSWVVHRGLWVVVGVILLSDKTCVYLLHSGIEINSTLVHYIVRICPTISLPRSKPLISLLHLIPMNRNIQVADDELILFMVNSNETLLFQTNPKITTCLQDYIQSNKRFAYATQDHVQIVYQQACPVVLLLCHFYRYIM